MELMSRFSGKLRFRIIAAAVATVSLGACVEEIDSPTYSSTSTGLVNGTVESDANFPWVVNLAIPAGSCRGVLIAPTWVLTAAHCVSHQSGVVTIYYSRTNPNTGITTNGSQITYPGSATRHPQWNPADPTSGYDIALVRLPNAFAPDPLLQTAFLPISWAAVGQQGTIVTSGDGSGTARVWRGNVVSSGCIPYSNEFCVQSATASACTGDSGGGFVTSSGGVHFVVGINANATDTSCSVSNSPHTATGVYPYAGWIQGITGTLPVPPRSASDLVWRNTDGTVTFWFMNSAAFNSVQASVAPGNDWQINGTGDFNHDGYGDLLWRNTTAGTVKVWLMNTAVIMTQPQSAVVPGLDWQISGTGDFNGDGNTDLLWRNNNGVVNLWFMVGGALSSQQQPSVVPGSTWQIKGTGDFNADGKADILWRHADGTIKIWLMNGGSIVSEVQSSTVPGSDWDVKGTGDFNDDDTTDILWRNTNGTVKIWTMSAGLPSTQIDVSLNPGNGWQIQGVGDFNKDGRDDIVWRYTDGSVKMWMMSGAIILSQAQPSLNPGNSWQIKGTGRLDW
ncbi:MAG: hypothetical protein JWP01_2305 [Myxococcales bacterium]|nr:hypothetical protein [Myxococcales bacterium]